MSLGMEQAENIIGKLFLIEDMGVANENVIEGNGSGTPAVGVAQMDELRTAVGRLNVSEAVEIEVVGCGE